MNNKLVLFVKNFVPKDLTLLCHSEGIFLNSNTDYECSTGGALTLRYVLEALATKAHRRPDKLFLFSPAIAVDPFAGVTDWHTLVSWIPIDYFERFKWLDINLEYDPFKYNSFPI